MQVCCTTRTDIFPQLRFCTHVVLVADIILFEERRHIRVTTGWLYSSWFGAVQGDKAVR